MLDFNVPRFPIGSDERQAECQAEMSAAMHRLIKEAIKRGWLECELSMALADVAEEHVITLAERKSPALYIVSSQ